MKSIPRKRFDKVGLPSNICVLDIETEQTDFADLEKTKLAFVGIKIYRFRRNHYCEVKHTVYYPGQLKDLGALLRAFPGIIIGHNVFQFDYRVLKTAISLKGIIEKTVDVLIFLYLKNYQRLRGLSLDGLSMLNLGKGKLFDGRTVCTRWRNGECAEVIAYNAVDIDLTMALRWLLISTRRIKVQYFKKLKERAVGPGDLAYLTGQKQFFKFKEWEDKIRKDGHVVKSRRAFFDALTIGEYGWLFCSICNRVFEVGGSMRDILIPKTFLDNIEGSTYGASGGALDCPECGRRFEVTMIESWPLSKDTMNEEFSERIHENLLPKRFKKTVSNNDIHSYLKELQMPSHVYIMKGEILRDYWDKLLIEGENAGN